MTDKRTTIRVLILLAFTVWIVATQEWSLPEVLVWE